MSVAEGTMCFIKNLDIQQTIEEAVTHKPAQVMDDDLLSLSRDITNFTDVAKLFGMNAAVLHDEWKYARRAPEDVELTIMASCPRLRATFPALSQWAVRLLLLPIGTATCERSFSAMNRLD